MNTHQIKPCDKDFLKADKISCFVKFAIKYGFYTIRYYN